MFRLLLFLLLLTSPTLAKEKKQLDSSSLCQKNSPQHCSLLKDLSNLKDTAHQMDIQHIIDGKTFIANHKEVTLWGVTLPEEASPYYPLSKEFLKLLLQRNTVSCIPTENTKGPKEIMHCFTDGMDLASLQIQMGFARDNRQETKGYYKLEEALAKQKKEASGRT